MNIRDLIENSVNENPDKTYLYFEDQEITYKEFNNTINRVGNGLLELGVKKGDKICIMMRNCPEFLYTWFAINKIGAVMVPINIALKEGEIRYILKHSEAKGIVVDETYLETVLNIEKECNHLEYKVCVERKDGFEKKNIKNILLFSELKENSSSRLKKFEIKDDDDALYIYTSGTTGEPKAVMISHNAWVVTGQAFVECTGVTSEDRMMTPNPLFHANAQVYTTMGSLCAKASLILVERFSASRLWDQTRRYKATELTLVGAMTPMIWNQPEKENDADNPVRILVAGYVAKEYFSKFEKRFGVTVLTIFSLTEATMGLMGPLDGVRKIGGVGKPMRHPDPAIQNMAKIVDKTGIEVPSRTIGEIIFRNPAMMKGYFKDKERTAETIRDGWVFTGDKGYMDEDGYVFFVGREKDIIVKKGENVSALEIENIINKHPKVLESAVIAVPSGLGDDEIKALVVLRDLKLQPEGLIDWCSKNLADFKVPRYVEFRNNLPKTPLGKIRKDLLRKET
jgi:crotonobetaine/carnitine-CoA ligase